jgi:riboflavin-specific deaminase-like protein
MRNISDAVLVGVDTIIRDNPRLTVRLKKGRNPKKIILDARLRTPLYSNVLRGKAALSTIIATTSLADQRKIKKIETTGAKVWSMKKDRTRQVDLKGLLQELGQRNFRSILVEGGSKIISSFLRYRLADHLVVVIAPQILGRGINSVSSSTVSGFKNLVLTPSPRYFLSGYDVILQAFLKKQHQFFLNFA